ncbi:hypothetical protein MW084_11815 [Streptomyces sudanensis]|uniref:Uncharacterized protein n=1 Tax=Streptomyces sudanensis TaxID=436397 RepID=A0ABY4TDJ2_9ACTN|nr:MULTISPECIES: hypothetical protein [Streptomyces]URN16511.1 hypothetical protein MW084_11815 [Streptomyces sudanensis]
MSNKQNSAAKLRNSVISCAGHLESNLISKLLKGVRDFLLVTHILESEYVLNDESVWLQMPYDA